MSLSNEFVHRATYDDLWARTVAAEKRIAALESQNAALLADVNQDEGYERLKEELAISKGYEEQNHRRILELEAALQLIGNELSLHADQGPAGEAFRALRRVQFASLLLRRVAEVTNQRRGEVMNNEFKRADDILAYTARQYADLLAELERYKHALWEANGYRIQAGLEPVKLDYSQSDAEEKQP